MNLILPKEDVHSPSGCEEAFRGRALSNHNASEAAAAVYQYLWEIYGNKILAGQQESTWVAGPDYEIDYIKQTTGKLPAIRGLDYIDHDFDGVNQRAADWWKLGGLVTICYHWGAPPGGAGYEASKGKIDMNLALEEGSPLNRALKNEMKTVAQALLELKEQGGSGRIQRRFTKAQVSKGASPV